MCRAIIFRNQAQANTHVCPTLAQRLYIFAPI